MLCLELPETFALLGLGAFVRLGEKTGALGGHPGLPVCVWSQRPCLRRRPPARSHRAPHIWRSFQAHVGVKVRWGWRRVVLEGRGEHARGRRAPRGPGPGDGRVPTVVS